jgi:hypothetical protein
MSTHTHAGTLTHVRIIIKIMLTKTVAKKEEMMKLHHDIYNVLLFTWTDYVTAVVEQVC